MEPNTVEVPVEEKYVGYVVAEDIVDSRGMLLLAKGLTLTEYKINALKKRGVEKMIIYERGTGE